MAGGSEDDSDSTHLFGGPGHELDLYPAGALPRIPGLGPQKCRDDGVLAALFTLGSPPVRSQASGGSLPSPPCAPR